MSNFIILERFILLGERKGYNVFRDKLIKENGYNYFRELQKSIFNKHFNFSGFVPMITNKEFFGYDLDILKEIADLNGVTFESYKELKEDLQNE